MSIEWRNKPFPHQQRTIEESAHRPHYGLFHDCGLGKSFTTLATAAILEAHDEIDGLLILAPKHVTRQWALDEIPAHLPHALAERSRVLHWRTDIATRQYFRQEAQDFADHPGFQILCLSYPGMMTEPGRAFAKDFLSRRRCLYVLDESPAIKTPGSKRTKRILASAKHAPYRRILTGTPVDNSPFDLDSQLRFLDPTVWHPLGIRNPAAFRAYFGYFINTTLGNGRSFPKLVEYRNLDALRRIVDENGSRLRKEDVLDLPPRLYSSRYVELTPAQRRAYNDVEREYQTFIGDDSVTADLAVVRLQRLRQITSGYAPTDEDQELRYIVTPDKNPRLRALVETVQEADHQVIVWAVYRKDVTDILHALAQARITAGRFDGQATEDEANAAVDGFKSGELQCLVGNPAKGAEGLNLTCARTQIFFNRPFKLSQNIQAEDRNHRIGQSHSTAVIDLIAVDTVDLDIVRALREKRNVAALVQGDPEQDWI